MKVTYIEEIEHKYAWHRDMYCPVCGAHEYEIVHQKEPYPVYYIRCPQCGAESMETPCLAQALAWWKHPC